MKTPQPRGQCCHGPRGCSHMAGCQTVCAAARCEAWLAAHQALATEVSQAMAMVKEHQHALPDLTRCGGRFPTPTNQEAVLFKSLLQGSKVTSGPSMTPGETWRETSERVQEVASRGPTVTRAPGHTLPRCPGLSSSWAASLPKDGFMWGMTLGMWVPGKLCGTQQPL